LIARQSSRFKLAILSLLVLGLLVVLSWPFLYAAEEKAQSAQNQPIRLGVLAFRSIDATYARWQPLVDHLNRYLPQQRFELVPLFYGEFNQAFDAGQLDYVFTNPQHFVLLKRKQALHPLVTLMPLAEGKPVNQFGGVIFTRSDRADVNTLSDVPQQTIAATFEQSFGGYLMQRWELYRRGYDTQHVQFTGMPHDRVVQSVLNREADVGFVRTGILEALVKEGKLNWAQIKVIASISPSHFPQIHSTALYPEWPLAAMAHLGSELNKQVSIALLNIQPDSHVARLGEFYGFTPPGDYAPIEAVMLQLDVIPREDINLGDIFVRYSAPIVLTFVASLLLFSLLVMRLILNNRHLKRLSQERDQLNLSLQSVNQNLENIVEQRTQALRESEQRFYQMFENHASPMLLISPATGAILDANNAAAEFYGYDTAHLKAMNIHQINTLPKEQIAAERERAHSEKRNYFVFPHRLANGEVRQVEVHSSPVMIAGEPCLFSIVHDISERLKTEARLKLHDTALNYAANAIAITDHNSRVIWANRAYYDLTGYGETEIVGHHLYNPEQASDEDKALFEQIQHVVRQGQVWHGILERKHKNGDQYVEEITITPVRDSEQKINNFVVVLQDVTERKQAEQQIQNLAFFDPLTQLPNRRLLIDRLESAMAQTARNQYHGALLFLDLDHFKILNDSHGHQLGDKLLIEVAQRIKSGIRAGDTVARFGGDEFVVLLTDLDTQAVKAAQQAMQVAETLRQKLSDPYLLDGAEPGTKIQHYSSASIGISLFQDHNKPLNDLLKWTDMAMYQAKASGRNDIRLFDPQMQIQLNERAELEQDLRQAISQQQLQLHYQSQVDSQGRILGAEALLRWQHPQRGMISPAQFIPLAEETGLILSLGDWVLETACQQLNEWRYDPKLCLIQLSVNISAKQLRQRDFVETVTRLVKRYEVNPLMLKLELTESVLMSNMDDSVNKMRALRLLGIQFSIDDFGTGYSSLAYLKLLPLSQIKIDQSFIRDIADDEMDAVMVQAIMTLGESFQMSVIAEGVETDQQFSLLRDYRCQFFQGYLFSKPLPLAEFKQKVLTQNT